MAKTHIDRVCEHYLKEIGRGLQNPICQMFLSGVQQEGVGNFDQETLSAFKKWPYVQQLELASKLLSSMMHGKVERGDDRAPPAKALVHFHYLAYAAQTFDNKLYEIFDRERISLQPTKQLMQRIFQMKPPKIDPDDPVAEEIRKKFWYFDFAQASYPYENFEIKAASSDNVKLYFRSAFWNPQYGTLGVCLVSNLGTEDYVYSFMNEEDECLELSHSSGIADESTAKNICQRVFEKMLILAMYHHTQKESDTPDPDAYRILTDAMKRPSTKKDRQAPKGISLFSVTELGISKKDSTALPPSASGREYSHAFVVHGFFRWQRHGEKNRKRKLIYIDDFVKGGSDKPIMNKDKLHKLK